MYCGCYSPIYIFLLLFAMLRLRWCSKNIHAQYTNVHALSCFCFYQYSEEPQVYFVIFIQPGSIDLQSLTGEE